MFKTTTAFAGALGLLVCGTTSVALAQETNDAPLQDDWWSASQEFGAEDKAGAIQRIKPEDVMRAVALVEQGKTATLGKIYAADIPFFGARGFKLIIPGTPTGGPLGSEKAVFHDEMVITEIGQVGTQFDGPGHVGVHTSEGNLFYGRRDSNDAYERGPANMIAGMGDLGVEHVAEHAYVCRGVLLDAASYRGVDRLPVPDPEAAENPGIITADDVQAIMEQQGLEPLQENDCVFIHTGHGDLWGDEEWQTLSAEEKRQRAAEFNAGEPGFGTSACEYFAEQKIVLTGGDTFATEAIPGEDPNEAIPCHVFLQPKYGIWNLENLDFSQLLEDGVHEFMFTWAPLKIKGGTGSPGNPVAIY